MEIAAINLNELLNIIPDDSGLESIHLGIIFEYVGEEGDLLEVGVSHRRSHKAENHTSSVSETVSKGGKGLRLEEDLPLFAT